MPPPLPAELAEKVQLLNVPPPKMPPPHAEAEFIERVLFWTVKLPLLSSMAPPNRAEFAARVLFWTLKMPWFSMPPPYVAELAARVLSWKVKVPWLKMPPPAEPK